PDRFFVRTLTANDVEKLHARTPGTFEPDLGETARDRFPTFWGWPQKYATVTRQLTRLEWNATARLFSNGTPSEGVEVALMLWFREARTAANGQLGHAAEHRFRPGPISTVRRYVPERFDAN